MMPLNPQNVAGLVDALHRVVPAELHDQIHVLMDLLANQNLRALSDNTDAALAQLLATLSGVEVQSENTVVAFGTGNQFGDISIRDIAGRDIINVSIQLPPPLPSSFPKLRIRPVVRDFVGRQNEIAQVVAAFRGDDLHSTLPVFVIRGMGGSGKTELSHAAAAGLATQFSDGQLLVDLGGQSPLPLTPAQILGSILHIIAPQDNTTGSVYEFQHRIRAELETRRVLILADNVRDESQVRPLIDAVPVGCGVIITTRQRFALPDAKFLDLKTLDPTSARALVCGVCPRSSVYVDQLVHLCGYLPLALRVSASLLSSDDTIPVSAYIERLTKSKMTYLADPESPDDPARSVAASLSTSFDSLPIETQQVLCQLSVFPASFDRDAMTYVVDATDPERLIGLLRRRSFVEWDEIQQRFDLHDLVRAFGESRLADLTTVRYRHTHYYARLAAKAEALYLQGGAAMKEGLALFDRERQHIDTAWAWVESQAGDIDADVLMCAFTNATAYLGHLRYDPARERIPHLEAAVIAARRRQNREAEGDAIGHLGNAYRALGNPERAITLFKERLKIVREMGNRNGEGSVLGNLGNAYRNIGELELAKTVLEEALSVRREVNDRHGIGNTLGSLASVYLDIGDIQRSITLNEERLHLTREIGDIRGEAGVLGNIGRAYSLLGDHMRAEEFLNEALILARQLGDQRAEHAWLRALAQIADDRADTNKAISHYEEALRAGQVAGNLRGVAQVTLDLSRLYERQDDFARALEAQQQHISCLLEIKSTEGEIEVANRRLVEFQARIDAKQGYGRK